MRISYVFLAAAATARDDDKNDDVWYGEEIEEVADTSLARGKGRQRHDADMTRYDDLESMAVKYWNKQGLEKEESFNAEQFWQYGCHCWFVGGNAISAHSQGPPLDKLDNKCKAYKNCLKCVRNKHGDACLMETNRYTWKYASKEHRFVAKNTTGTCKHDLFECDVRFLKDTFSFRTLYDSTYDPMVNEYFDRTSDDYCPKNGVNRSMMDMIRTRDSNHSCCGGDGNPYFFISDSNQQCCKNKPLSLEKECV